MDYIIDFYKELDSINLIIFWGVIIVITLLVIFSILLALKNRELKKLVAEKQAKRELTNSDIPIKRNDPVAENRRGEVTKVVIEPPRDIPKEAPKEEKVVVETPVVVEKDPEPALKSVEITQEPPKEVIIPVVSEPAKIVPEKTFVAEEHVINYHQELSMPKMAEPESTPKPAMPQEASTPKPYQRNVLREMYSNQTSPIGIVRTHNTQEMEHQKAEELHQSLETEPKVIKEVDRERVLENTNSFNELAKRNNDNESYLNEVSNKLSEAMPEIERTEYEMRQEADAIISYEELMQKKDTIKTIDEEEAVISIEELYQKEKAKLYGITDNEPDDKFIDELKNFRNDL